MTTGVRTTSGQPTSTSVPDHSQPLPSATLISTQSAITSPTVTSTALPFQQKSHTVAIAVGFGAGIPTILAVAGFLLYYFRRHRGQPSESDEMGNPLGSSGESGESGEPGGEPGYGHKAELSAESRPLSEMPGSLPGSPEMLMGEMDGSTINERSPPQSQSPFFSPMRSEFSGKAREHRLSEMHELPG